MKDPAWSPLWHRFDPWPGNFHMPQAQPPTPPPKNECKGKESPSSISGQNGELRLAGHRELKPGRKPSPTERDLGPTAAKVPVIQWPSVGLERSPWIKFSAWEEDWQRLTG